jgi:coniferyl-aldehyde dehydrogenase
LKKQLARYQDVLADAISLDFGGRAHAETKMLDVLPSTLEIDHAIRHVARWMEPSRRATELLFLTNSLRVTYQPKGVVGVIGTWNFPVYVSIGPLAAALAAGNRVMIKMPEVTPATSSVLRRMLGEVFAEDHVAVVGEELVDPSVFTTLPLDHIFFTGSPAVGRIVMRQASQNLTPVTLELGGKSPAFVMRDYPVREAARRVAHGQGSNCGQICVSPDPPRHRLRHAG